jgi:hypothetical protein
MGTPRIDAIFCTQGGIPMQPLLSRPQSIATCLAAAVFAGACALQAGTIDDVNRDNLDVLQGEGITLILEDAGGQSSSGYLAFAQGGAPGVTVYQERFSTGSGGVRLTFDGCIMAKTDLEDPENPAPNCRAERDSGKRFKLNATEAAPLDLVFDVTDDDTGKLYRVFGKISNKTAGRFSGFKVELGFGIGDAFQRSLNTDQLELVEASVLGRFPGGLFGGSPSEGDPFFTVGAAVLWNDEAVSAEDILATYGMPTQYSDIFGDWLPNYWVPTGWFYDFDGNPATDDELLAWFDGTAWLTYDQERMFDLLVALKEREVTGEELAGWMSQPVTVTLGAEGPLVATWDPDAGEEGLYVIEPAYVAEFGEFLTAEEMRAEIQGSSLVRVPGYVQGPIEDLANANTNFAIRVGRTAAWPHTSSFTLRITPIASEDFSERPAWIADDVPEVPEVPEVPASGSSSGCSVGATGEFDPLLPGLVLIGLAYLGLRRRGGVRRR